MRSRWRKDPLIITLLVALVVVTFLSMLASSAAIIFYDPYVTVGPSVLLAASVTHVFLFWQVAVRDRLPWCRGLLRRWVVFTTLVYGLLLIFGTIAWIACHAF